jgi:hypothetical protein
VIKVKLSSDFNLKFIISLFICFIFNSINLIVNQQNSNLLKMSTKYKPSKTQARELQCQCPATAEARGVTGMGINAGSNRLAYPMVLLLKKFLVTMKKGEHVVESQRQRLASLPEFEPHAAFQRIDRDADGLINSVDLLRFLRQNGVEEANESDCNAVVKYFDSLEEGALNYSDFLQIIMPCDDMDLRAELAQRPNYLV